jgi:hypothetical protein
MDGSQEGRVATLALIHLESTNASNECFGSTNTEYAAGTGSLVEGFSDRVVLFPVQLTRRGN